MTYLKILQLTDKMRAGDYHLAGAIEAIEWGFRTDCLPLLMVSQLAD